MGLNFKTKTSDIWGIQYHPEITYEKMVSLIHFRKERLIDKGAFKDQNENFCSLQEPAQCQRLHLKLILLLINRHLKKNVACRSQLHAGGYTRNQHYYS